MKRFCPNCGAEIENGTVFCGNCGGRIPEEEVPVTGGFENNVPGSKNASPAGSILNKLPSNLNVKLIAIAGGAVAALIVIIIVICVILSNTGKSGFFKKTMNAVIDLDAETLTDNTSNILLDYIDDNNGDVDYYTDYMEEYIGVNLTDKFDNNVGHNYKVSYVVDESYTAKDREISKLLNSVSRVFSAYGTVDEDFVDDAEDTIEEMYVSEVKITAKQDRKTKTVNATVYMTKEEGQWKLFNIQF